MNFKPEPAKTEDLIPLRSLLAQSDLVQDDLTPAHLAHFFVIRSADGDQILGAAGLELRGWDGLLRSVALAPEMRGQGAGRGLVKAVEDLARALGRRHLWLLTTTAPTFFTRLDYLPAERALAPAEVQGSAEFAALCPASAVCLAKSL